MKSEEKADFFGPPVSQHGQYTFYKGFKFKVSGQTEVILLGEFVLVKMWPEEETVAIAEVQLCWFDRIQEANFSSVKLYFLPENTADGRNLTHGQDEVVSLTENVIIRIDDLISLVPETYQWQHGKIGVTLRPNDTLNAENLGPVKDYNPPYCCRMTGALCMKNLRKEKKALGADSLTSQVIIVSYASYCRFRGALRRFEGNTSAFANALVMALGGFAVPSENTRVLFCKDTFEYPELEGHELLCNHLAPKFPNKRAKKTPLKYQHSPVKLEPKQLPLKLELKTEDEEEIPRRNSLIKPCHRPLAVGSPAKPRPPPVDELPPRSLKLSAAAMAEQTFLERLYKFMKSRGTPIDRLPCVGTEKLNLYKFYTVVKKVGGYEAVCLKRLWRRLYLEMGGYCSNNAAATATRKHYEKFLLPFEQHMNNQPIKQPNKGQQPAKPAPVKQNGSLPANGPELRPRVQPTTPPHRAGRKRRRKNRTPVKVEKENFDEYGQVKEENGEVEETKPDIKRSVDEIDSKTECNSVTVRIVKEAHKSESQAEATVPFQSGGGVKQEASPIAGPSTSLGYTNIRPFTQVKPTSQVHVPRPGAHQSFPADILPALRTLSELNISIVAADGSKISTGADGKPTIENATKRTTPRESESAAKRPKIEPKSGAVFDIKTGLLTGGDNKSPIGLQYFKHLGSGFSITPVIGKKPEKRPVPPLISIEKTQKETKELISNVNMLMNRPDLKVEVKPVQNSEKVASVSRAKIELIQTPSEVLDLTKKKGLTVYPVESSPRKEPPRPTPEQKPPTPRLQYQPFINPIVPFAPGLIYRPGLPPNYLQMMRMAAMPVANNPAMIQIYKDMIQNGTLRQPMSDLERLMAMQQTLQKR